MTEEKTGIDISDSVVMGDVHQNIQKNTLKTDVCPSCSASNVKVMKCQEVGCTSKQFCELCHINCRYSEGSVTRFDSGVGSGPFCSECVAAKYAAWIKRLEQERLEQERLERERLEQLERERLEQERLAREAQWERERLERERLGLETESKKNSLEIWLHRRNMKRAYLCTPLYGFGLHRFILSRITGLVYPLTLILMHMLEGMDIIPNNYKWGWVLIPLLIYDLFQIPKWSREKSRKDVLKYAPSFEFVNEY